MANDYWSDLGKSISGGFDKIGKSLDGEVKKIHHDHIQNINKDFDDVSKAIDKGGLFGGACKTFEKLSPGHIVANSLQELHVIPDDPKLREGVEGAVNLAYSPLVPGFGCFLWIEGAGQLIDSMSPAKPGVPPSEAQANQPPSTAATALTPEQRHAAIESCKEQIREKTEEAREEARERIALRGFNNGGMERFPTVIRDGYAPAPTIEVNLYNDYGAIGSRLEDLYGKKKIDQANDAIDRILNNPNLSFEDMIFELMRALMKDGQGDVKKLTDEMNADSKSMQKDIDDLSGKIEGLRKSGKKPDDPELASLLDKRAGLVQKRQESREEVAEKIKNATEKLSEMQQALSNILSSMHENAMSAIRNIK